MAVAGTEKRIPTPDAEADIAKLRHEDNTSAIKTMKLYSQVDRVLEFLKADPKSKGYFLPHDIKEVDIIDHATIMTKYDNMSYMTETVFEEISVLLELKRAAGEPRKRLLDFGCGIAGPMRSVARVSDCDAFGVELQADLAEAANKLSTMCGMDGSRENLPKCEVKEGDLLKMGTDQFGGEKFDALKSLLVILHIPQLERPPIFDKMVSLLKPGAPIVIEDYVMLKPFSTEIKHKLATEVYAQELPNQVGYQRQLEDAGLVDVNFIDLTATWTEFVTSRRDAFIEKKEWFVGIQNEKCYEDLLRFYNAVVACFESGELGGFRITARRAGLVDAGRVDA